ncbi:MAG: hypothetical protein QOC82_491 [Frankiaceae bacterium]|jgi:predicted Zn-dependent protease with MMP-like domain|nr:hypothetical protein [Frankiaceae bacterium]
MQLLSSTAAGVTVVTLGLTGTFAAPPAAATTTTYSVTHASDPYSGRSIAVRWTPCLTRSGVTTTTPISYAVNTGGDPSRVTLVQQALAEVTAYSGLRFHYTGKVSYIPHYAVLHYPTGDRLMFNAAQQRAATHAALVIGWASASKTNMFRGSEAGVGTVSWTGNSRSQLRIVEGAALIKLGVPLRAGFTTGTSVGSLLLHEIGHAVGLNHVSTTSQIMYPVLGSYTRASYQSGDRYGLRLVGRPAGCFVTPSLSPPDPAAIARAAGISVTL